MTKCPDVNMPLDVEAKKLKIWSGRNEVKIPEECELNHFLRVP